ncbi:MAG: hypothetical protein V1874_09385 [Spirochaetota bacterium]
MKGINTITDRRLFQDILGKFFFNKSCFLYGKEGALEVKFNRSSDGLIVIKIPFFTEEPTNCIAFTRQGANIIFVYLKLCGRKEDNIYIFNPAKFQIAEADRKDERKSLIKNTNSKSVLYITNFISDNIINKSLSSQAEKLDRIKEIIAYDHLNEYEYLKLFFCNEEMNDARMKYFNNSRIPIFIPNIHSENANDELHEYYKNYIYNNDEYLKIHKEIVSEVAVPILFDSKIPYGYIQVNKTGPLPTSTISVMKRVAALTDDITKKSKLFSVSSDKLLVWDISEKGVGIAFKNTKYIPYYRRDSFVSLDLLLPRYKKASILADVRHLEMLENKLIKVGFEIKDMDTASRDNYEKFLGSISA